ncbi:MAG: tRNA uridine-5-carboxymethylaminomethyl(34) synthesis GTPase MnmE [Rikenellaceae bacterium]
MSELFTNVIVAPATGVGCALSIVRLSGVGVLDVVAKLFRRELKPRVATFGVWRDSAGEMLDEVVVTYYKAPASFTGEDMVEVSCHGSAWVTSALVRSCVESGAQVARAGEFSQRAMMNGKIDLSQAEAIADLIASDSKASARVAFQQIRGGYSQEFRVLRAELLKILALLELELDFGEEEVEFASRSELSSLVERIRCRVEELRASFSLGNVLKNGVSVAIVGAPNVGKSTLLNALVGEQRAIVSNVAGTTRDYIEVPVTIDGVVYRFVDTAGIRESSDEIERSGIERSEEQLRRAQVVLHLVVDSEHESLEVSEGQHYLRVYNKCDKLSVERGDGLSISAKYGTGLDALRGWLSGVVSESGSSSSALIVSNERHYELLCSAGVSFQRALSAISESLPGELISSELRTAMYSLEEITGEITTTDILTEIFSNFCIGK